MAETSEFPIHLNNGKETLCNNYLEYLHIWINGKIITLKQMKHTLWSKWTQRTFVGFDVLTAMTMNNTIFCELMPCSPAEPYRRFQGTFWLQARRCNQFLPPKRWWISTRLHNFTSPKPALFLPTPEKKYLVWHGITYVLKAASAFSPDSLSKLKYNITFFLSTKNKICNEKVFTVHKVTGYVSFTYRRRKWKECHAQQTWNIRTDILWTPSHTKIPPWVYKNITTHPATLIPQLPYLLWDKSIL